MSGLWLVRHGPTHARTMVGWTDLPADLSNTQALARLDRHLPQAPVVSSDLARARATAEAIAGARPRLPDEPGLREIHFGTWENRGFAEIEAEDPERIRAFWESPGTVAPPGGESWHDLASRVTATIDRLRDRHADLIVVCHFGPILTQIERALGLSTVEVFAHRIENLSVTDLRHGPAGWTTGRINHLP